MLGGIAVLATNLFQVWSPWIVRQAVDHLQHGTARATLMRDAGLILLAVALQGLFLFLMRMTLIRSSRQMEYELRNDLYDHMQRLHAGFYRRTRVGDLLSRTTNDLDAVRNFLGPGIMYFANTVVTFCFAVTLMCRIDVRLTLISLIPLPLLSLTVARLGATIHRYYEAIQDRFGRLTAKAQETLAGIRVVKAYVEEEGEYDAFRAIHEDYTEQNRKMIQLWSMMGPMMGLLGGIANAVVLWIGGSAVVSGRISLGDLVAFQIYLMMLLWPMISLGWVSNLFQRGEASMARIRAILEEPIELDLDWGGAERATARSRAPNYIAIELRDVGFKYPGSDRYVLRGLDLAVRPGERLAIVGRTGAGKSTLLALLARLYDPDEGTILVCGRDAREWSHAELRRVFGIVPQESFLFSDTIRANVAFGFDDSGAAPSPDGPVARAGLARDLEQFSRGLDTIIGERGITLSGGQKQRVALARALALERPVLLLDDAFASVDPGTEEEILDALFEHPSRPTLLLATHRRSALLRVDRIVVLDEGNIVDSGTHAELIHRGGLYADLYHREEVVEELETL
ncbi:MAG: ABC transporter ATP-binding protein [Candidatus Eisenbacteria bacterium]|uniref:ABC transporter ATP-binding protein n=1 Tax=Eiseniibacteriota bacterium TaxID=2212470 RepID=A0A538T9X7_UNCEI|nr:MAG: ABC transporter ATP-binding protein [Candidatus Eisenbacteria bacterium]